MMSEQTPQTTRTDRLLTLAETVLYTMIAVLLSLAALALLGVAAWEFLGSLQLDHIGDAALHMLNKLLLVLMIIELLYTVQVSLREHTLIAEPFLIVGLIAGVRRILVITAEAWHLGEMDPAIFRMAMVELALISLMTLVIVTSIILLRHFKIDRTTGD